MSKHLELLRRAERERSAFEAASRASLSSRPQLRLRPDSRTSEEAVKLVQQVFLSGGLGAPGVVVFSGVEHGDGCSYVCACAAEALAAQMPGALCVLDANLRTPSMHKYFNIGNTPGLVEALEQEGPVRDFIQQVGTTNLWVLPTGSARRGLAGTLSLDRLRSRIADLRSEFDAVLIDAPPVNLYVDGIAFGQLADGLILVLQSGSTCREAARKAKESLQGANVRLLGAVLNKRTFPIPQALYDRL